MKTKLITILNQCVYNKTIEDFNDIVGLINIIKDDKTENIKLSQSNIGLYVSMFYDAKLFRIMFTDNNMLLFSMPDDMRKTYVIKNCGYNMQYDEIKALLS